jgi:hypothetical protein
VKQCASALTADVFAQEVEALWRGHGHVRPEVIAELPESSEDDSHTSKYLAMLALGALAYALESCDHRAAREHLCSIALNIRSNLDTLVDESTVYPIVGGDSSYKGSLERDELQLLEQTCGVLLHASSEDGIRERLSEIGRRSAAAVASALVAAKARGGIV